MIRYGSFTASHNDGFVDLDDLQRDMYITPERKTVGN